MDLGIVIEFIRPELLIITVFLWCLGLFFKKAPFFKAEWLIPFVLLGISIVTTIIYIAIVCGEGFAPTVIVTGFIQGVVIAALSVFGNEVLKQVTSKRYEDLEKNAKVVTK